MSYQEKRTLTIIITMSLVFVAYCLYAFSTYQIQDSIQLWARTMLIFMGIGAVTTIIIQIIFHVLFAVGIAVKEAMHDHDVDESRISEEIQGEMIEDERDKLIELKSRQAGFITSGAGFMAALIVLSIGLTPVVAINLIFASFFIGSVAEGIVNMIFYRRGVVHV